MFTIGTSAYLKLTSLGTKPQRTEVRKRITPSDTPYDYHRSLKLHANRLLAKGEDLKSVLESASHIAKAPERNSVLSGLSTLLGWRQTHTAEFFEVDTFVKPSPHGTFKLKFTADFGTVIDGKRCGVHLWNTKRPPLDKRFSSATLSMLKEHYSDLDGLAILSLLDSSLIWSTDEFAYADLGRRLMMRLEEVIMSVEEEMSASNGDRPLPPSQPTVTI